MVNTQVYWRKLFIFAKIRLFSMEDKELQRRLGRGDEKAFADIYDRYAGKCVIFIDSLVKDETVAKDLAHDLFIKIWTRREIVSKAESLDAYIFRMARNAVLDLFHSRAIARRYLASETLRQDGIAVDADAKIDEDELQLLIYRSVEAMPPQRRRVFRMSRYYGIPNIKIAEELGIDIRTVENHLTAALRSLRMALQSAR